jgi:predicted ribosome quality control (RQC) complex YloA/Tae2 family protein
MTDISKNSERTPQTLVKDEKLGLQTVLARKLKRAQRLLKAANQTAQDSLEWEKISHEGLLLQSHFYLLKKGSFEVIVPDWENENKDIHIALDPLLDPKTEIEKRFKKSRKLRRAGEHAQRLIEKAEKEIRDYSQLLTELAVIQSPIDLEGFRKQHNLQLPGRKAKSSQPPAKSLPYRQFYTAAGLTLWVGKSAKNNDTVTFSCANGSDWWLHVRNFPGSHVILRCGKHQEPDQDSIQDAVQLAIAYSKAKNQGEAEVCLTQCKFVTRYGKGQAGKVQISKHQVIYAQFDQERFQKLKERSSIMAC